VTGYRVYRDGHQVGTVRGAVSNAYDIRKRGGKHPSSTYTDTGLTNGTTYTYYTTSTTTSGTTSAPSNTVSVTPGVLAWAPPSCGDATHACQDVYLTNTGSHQVPSLSSNTDYRIHLPTSGPLVGGITIADGHNVQIIGGEIDMTYPCSNDANGCMGIYIDKSSPGAVFVEGVWIHNPSTIPSSCSSNANSSSQPCSTGDGIDVNTTNNDVINVNTITLENLRIDGLSGGSGYGDHTDVLQPYQAPNDTIQIDHLTGYTNDQGMQIDPDMAWDVWGTYPTSITVLNTNINVTNSPYSGNSNRYAWWLTDGLACNSGPITLSGDYTKEPDGTLNGNSVWPDIDQPSGCKSVWASPVLSFPSSPQITGVLTSGLPPAGDWVPVGTAGTSYVSPGYQ
jgi:hypothetical protein